MLEEEIDKLHICVLFFSVTQKCHELPVDNNVVGTEWCVLPKMAAPMATDLCSDLFSTVAEVLFSYLLDLTFVFFPGFSFPPSYQMVFGSRFGLLFSLPSLLSLSDLTLC